MPNKSSGPNSRLNSPGCGPAVEILPLGCRMSSADLAAEAQAIAQISDWLDIELDKLVATWRHLAAPSADAPLGRNRPR